MKVLKVKIRFFFKTTNESVIFINYNLKKNKIFKHLKMPSVNIIHRVLYFWPF